MNFYTQLKQPNHTFSIASIGRLTAKNGLKYPTHLSCLVFLPGLNNFNGKSHAANSHSKLNIVLDSNSKSYHFLKSSVVRHAGKIRSETIMH